ncbi:putative ribonuclease H-like domain-containing protein [Tanacetum coccineum]
MTGNRSYLTDYEEIDGGLVAFGELKFNLFSVSQMCDKKNSVLFTNTEYVVMSPYFKLTDESHVLFKVPRKDNMYSVDLKNVIPQGGLTCLFAKATPDESNLWHRRLGHVNFKTRNKLVKGNLVRDHLGKFDGKADEGFFIGYSTNSKAFRVFNSRTRIVEENLHVQFSENTPNIAGSGPNWLSDIDALIKSINYKPCVVGNQSNGSLGTKACDNTGEEEKKDVEDLGNEDSEVPSTEKLRVNQEKDASLNSTNTINIVSPTVNAVGIEDNAVDENIVYGCDDDLNMHDLEDIASSENEVVFGAEADMTNLDTHILVSPIPTTRIHKDHPVEQMIRDIHSAPQTRRMTKSVTENAMFKEPKKVIQALKDPSWIEDMKEELLQFKLQQVWTLVDLPNGKRAIGTKWVYMNKKDERGIVIRNKARIEAIRIFLAYASYKDFVVYQMDVKSELIARMETDSPDTRFKPSGEEEKKDTEDSGYENSKVPSIEEPRVNQSKMQC